MSARECRKTAVTVLSGLLLGALVSTAARAQVKRLDMQLDGFCTVECRNDIRHALYPFQDEYEELTITPEKHRVTFVPKSNARVQLWDIIRQLRNAERIPVRTTVLAAGHIEDYLVSLAPRERLFMRKVLFVAENGLRFMLNERDGFAEAVAASASGTKPVTVFGEVIAWDEYHLPILVVKAVKAADAEWTDEEVESLLSREDSEDS